MGMDFDDFMATYDPQSSRVVVTHDVDKQKADSAFIVVTYGKFAVVLNPMGLHDHLCIDAHPFVDGKDAAVSAFGMSRGSRAAFPEGYPRSHGWPAANLVALLLGEQEGAASGSDLPSTERVATERLRRACVDVLVARGVPRERAARVFTDHGMHGDFHVSRLVRALTVTANAVPS